MQAKFTQSSFRLPVSRLAKTATVLFGSSIRFATASLLAIALVGAVGHTTSARAQQSNSLESINASTQAGGKVMIRATFKSPLGAIPNGFTVTNPARIAIDLPNIVNGLGKSVVEVGQGDVRTINVVEAGNRTRLVINLTKTLTYSAALDGNALMLTLDGGTQSALKETAQVTRFAEPAPASAAARYSLRDVDFRRGSNGEGRVIVDLSSATTGIDIRQQGKVVIIDFVNTAAPKNLIRRLDVLDFATPVRTVDVIDQGANTRMIIEPRGIWEYSAYQTDTQFIVEVKAIKEDPNKLVQGTGYTGEKLSLNFQNIEVRAVLQVIADFTGLNIITSDTVGGNLTLRLKDVPWDQALDIILQSKGLSKRKNGNVVLIAPSDELATKEKLALEVAQQTTELEALRTESFVLSYAKASDVRGLLSDGQQKILSKRGSVTVDARTNTMFVQDVPARLDEVRRLVAQLDVPVRQVQIEARIVIADDNFRRQLGARFGTSAGITADGRNIGVSGSGSQANSIARGTVPTGFSAGDLNVNLPVAAAGALGLTFLNLGNGNVVNLELSALEADNRGKVVSNPRIVTADKRKATITQGTEIGFQTQASSGGTTTQFKPAVLSLDVTPQITPDDKVIMDLEIKKDSVGALIGGIPSIETRTLKTQVLADNGETVVLGGIYEQTTRTDITKVPLLGDIPILGHLFKTTTKRDEKTELLIFITPRIIKEQLSVR
ncbi:MAG: type IV pilus secretin PilQ [Aeromicrobium sp.]|nr:type IV pilus secretin PilQ [Burkholderiales bacterium]